MATRRTSAPGDRPLAEQYTELICTIRPSSLDYDRSRMSYGEVTLTNVSSQPVVINCRDLAVEDFWTINFYNQEGTLLRTSYRHHGFFWLSRHRDKPFVLPAGETFCVCVRPTPFLTGMV
jgi:hypothetical protein